MMVLADPRFTRNLYLSAMSATGFFLPLSEWMLTISIIAVIVAVVLSRINSSISVKFKLQAALAIFLSAYIVHILWMINTGDVKDGLTNLRIKLPMVIFPVVVTFSEPFSKKEIKIILSAFIAGVVISSMAGMLVKYEDVLKNGSDPRNISLFISHIRLALMAVFAVFASGWIYFSDKKRPATLPYLFSSLWLTAFLFILVSLTGIILFFLVSLITLLFIFSMRKGIMSKALISFTILLLIAVPVIFLSGEYRSFHTDRGAYTFPTDSVTASGNSYDHHYDRKDIENGNRVWIYICEKELSKEWNKRSTLDYYGEDKKGQLLRFTLIRYLTSCGLRKDSAGIARLGGSDIKSIEEGVANRLFTEGRPLKSKIYELIWQMDNYLNGGNPSGHSVTQRMEFLATGWRILRSVPLTGVGTGDLRSEYKKRYDTDNSPLSPEYRLLAHNQYLTFLVSFGITGFLLLLLSFILPLFITGAFRYYLPLVFTIILFLSMFWEDTLETHTGVSFFAYFYAVLIFGESEKA